MSGETLSFLIADDHPMVREALASALGQAFAGAAIAMAGSLAQVQSALEHQPETDALLLDLDMPGMDGLTGLALLRSDHPTVPIIVVSAARDAAVVRHAYEFGASAYIDKSASLEQIAGTVRAVLDGEVFAPPEAPPDNSFAQRAAQLTPQQERIFRAIVVHQAVVDFLLPLPFGVVNRMSRRVAALDHVTGILHRTRAGDESALNARD